MMGNTDVEATRNVMSELVEDGAAIESGVQSPPFESILGPSLVVQVGRQYWRHVTQIAVSIVELWGLGGLGYERDFPEYRLVLVALHLISAPKHSTLDMGWARF
jgi:hypothetical protein